MAKFHINSKGEVAACHATTGSCPFSSEVDHIEANSLIEANIKNMEKLHEEYSNAFSMYQKSLQPWNNSDWKDLSSFEKYSILRALEKSADRYDFINSGGSSKVHEINEELKHLARNTSDDDEIKMFIEHNQMLPVNYLIDNPNISMQNLKEAISIAEYTEFKDPISLSKNGERLQDAIDSLGAYNLDFAEKTKDLKHKPFLAVGIANALNESDKKLEFVSKIYSQDHVQTTLSIMEFGNESTRDEFAKVFDYDDVHFDPSVDFFLTKIEFKDDLLSKTIAQKIEFEPVQEYLLDERTSSEATKWMVAHNRNLSEKNVETVLRRGTKYASDPKDRELRNVFIKSDNLVSEDIYISFFNGDNSPEEEELLTNSPKLELYHMQKLLRNKNAKISRKGLKTLARRYKEGRGK